MKQNGKKKNYTPLHPPEVWKRVETERCLSSRPTNSNEPLKHKHTDDPLALASVNSYKKKRHWIGTLLYYLKEAAKVCTPLSLFYYARVERC